MATYNSGAKGGFVSSRGGGGAGDPKAMGAAALAQALAGAFGGGGPEPEAQYEQGPPPDYALAAQQDALGNSFLPFARLIQQRQGYR